MRAALAILSLLCVAMVPPVPAIKRSHKSAAVHQGAGAVRLISKVVLPATMTNTFVWQYPPGVAAENLWWNIEASSDLAHWSVVISNASGPGEVRVKRTDPPGFFRLSGRSSPW